MTVDLRGTVPQFATAQEAAVILRCSLGTIRRRLRRGTLPGVKLDGVWYVDLEAVSALFPSRKEAP